MSELPELQVMSVKIPVSDLAASRRWYADVFGLRALTHRPHCSTLPPRARVAELADARVLEARARKGSGVRIPPLAPNRVTGR